MATSKRTSAVPPQNLSRLQTWLADRFTEMGESVSDIKMMVEQMRLTQANAADNSKRTDERLDGVMRDVQTLKDWKIAKESGWTGPQKILAGLAACAGIPGGLYALMMLLNGTGHG